MSGDPRASGLATGVRRAAMRIAVGGVAVVAIALGAGMVARFTARRSNPAPGTFVKVNGRKTHVNCQGAGDTTVVLEAGLMDFSILWAEVQARVSRFTRVCSYDRAGLGWSDAGVTPRSSDVAIKELEQVLAAAGVSPPYVMVGHSYGGLIARRFSEAHRERVVGLVLVDAAHDEQLRRIPSLAAARTTTLRQFQSLQWMSALGFLAMRPSLIPARGLSGDAARRYRAVLASSDYFRGAAAELEVMEESFAAPASSPAPLGDTPVIVVSRGLSDTLPGTSHSAEEAEWRALQRDLLALSRQSVHVIAERSGHDVHVQQPEVVVGAIKWVQDRRR